MPHDAIFISTTIPFVNAAPHIGFAWELLIADVLARYHRARGSHTFFLTGTDDNSLKNVRAAERAGLSTRDYVRAQGERYEELARLLDISHDGFVRTGFDPRHAPAVDKLWRRCDTAGDIYRREYRGKYCVGCESFLAETQLQGGLCPEHESEPEEIAEQNYFFRLSGYEGRLRAALSQQGSLRISAEGHRREVRGWIERGLEDFSISRSRERARGWGLPVPGDPSQIVYVWFDALANYLSGLGYARDAPEYREHWRCAARRIHVVGKNVTRFHCIYWPALLASAGLKAPTDVVVHGFVTAEGRKIGKSLGNGVDPFELLERYGCDRLRYYLLQRFSLEKDGDFSERDLVATCNAHLSDQLGNLLRRVATLIEKTSGSTHRARQTRATEAQRPERESALLPVAQAVTKRAAEALERGAVDTALREIWTLVEDTNDWVSHSEPWRLAGQLRAAAGPRRNELEQQLDGCLTEACRGLLWASGLLAPFLPSMAHRLASQLAAEVPRAYRDPPQSAWGDLVGRLPERRSDVLVPRLA